MQDISTAYWLLFINCKVVVEVFWIEILFIFQLNGQKENKLVLRFLDKQKNIFVLWLHEEEMQEYYLS